MIYVIFSGMSASGGMGEAYLLCELHMPSYSVCSPGVSSLQSVGAIQPVTQQPVSLPIYAHCSQTLKATHLGQAGQADTIRHWGPCVCDTQPAVDNFNARESDDPPPHFTGTDPPPHFTGTTASLITRVPASIDPFSASCRHRYFNDASHSSAIKTQTHIYVCSSSSSITGS